MGILIHVSEFGGVRVTALYEGDFGLPSSVFTGAARMRISGDSFVPTP